MKIEVTGTEFSKTLQTRDGRRVCIYRLDGGGICPVHGAVENPDGGIMIRSWALDGAYYTGCDESREDLVPRPREVQYFLNVYKHSASIHNTAEGAKSCASIENALLIAYPVTVNIP